MMIVLFSMSVNEIVGNSDPIFNMFIFNFVNMVKVEGAYAELIKAG